MDTHNADKCGVCGQCRLPGWRRPRDLAAQAEGVGSVAVSGLDRAQDGAQGVEIGAFEFALDIIDHSELEELVMINTVIAAFIGTDCGAQVLESWRSRRVW